MSRRTNDNRASRRTTVKIDKPKPWGLIATSAVLVAFSGGVIGYAALNAGSGYVDPLERATSRFDSALVSIPGEKIARSHVPGIVDYGTNQPPLGGDHNNVPQTCKIYDKPVAPENVVHSMEHGAVWITYRPGLSGKQLDTLRDLADGNNYVVLSPYPNLKTTVSAQAWGQQMFFDNVEDDQLKKFVREFAGGPQSMEPGAVCIGTDDTAEYRYAETAPAAPAAPPAPAPSASPTS